MPARQVSVTGLVQGVGFRPFIARLARRHALSGWVRNESGVVRILVEGTEHEIAAFLASIRECAPPLARIDALESESGRPEGERGFRIEESVAGPGRLPVSPDVATCAACEAELFDPANRRYRYPFITCTDCGPRFTVISSMPYDRARTSMGVFRQCPACRAEYENPGDRRYHSETNSCAECGPRIWLDNTHDEVQRGPSDAVIHEAASLLRRGRILAVRGLGGFHLAVDGCDEGAVSRLRRRKAREAKPLAVMVRTLEDARAIARVSHDAARHLASPERPIVLVPHRTESDLAPSVAPGLSSVGVMLAYTPLHHLLLDVFDGPLVMTSGNASDEPIATGNQEARERLRGIADGWLLHDRDIVARYDDSVLRLVGSRPIFLRRSRGYAPLPLSIPAASPRPVIAVGPHLKNTFTLAAGHTAYVSPHIGDLENLETLQHFRQTVGRLQDLFQVRPEIAVRDEHPGYLSTREAESMGLSRIIAVQHHHAHIAAVLAEHGRTGPVLGVALDGIGFGDDGRIWGAEFLIADLVGYRRVGHLREAPMPGGDLAARAPWRCLLGYATLEPGVTMPFDRALDSVSDTERRVAWHQATRGLNAPITSSMGRLFDAAAAVLGVRLRARYEGQPPMELESLAGALRARSLPFPIVDGVDGRLVLDPLPLLRELGQRVEAGEPLPELAACFHESVADAASRLATMICERHELRTVALGGGVFQNRRLLDGISTRLEEAGLEVLTPRALGPGDGAISYGQAAVAAAILNREGDA